MTCSEGLGGLSSESMMLDLVWTWDLSGNVVDFVGLKLNPIGTNHVFIIVIFTQGYLFLLGWNTLKETLGIQPC